MLFNNILLLTFAVVTATASDTRKELSTEFGVSEGDIDDLLSMTDISSIDITKWSKAMHLDAKEVESWPKSVKTSALEEIKDTVQVAVDFQLDGSTKTVKRQQTNRQKVEQEVDGIIAQHRADHETDHRRRLTSCKSARCIVCASGLSVAYVGSLAVCGTAALTEEAISAGALTPVAAVQLGGCVTTASGVYGSGWAFCLGMG
ncbi:hypothetical protein FDECE_17049 [Fusarium decemcellulare]|nr:hypothetical protein FDECE_17049 [Fusarium decemcellulare]